jgi:hypothetical protein
MTAVDKIKAAAAKLGPEEQVELFRWWVESDTFKQRQLAALKRQLASGIEQLDTGRYQTYDDTNIMQLAEEVCQSGREQLKKKRNKPGA